MKHFILRKLRYVAYNVLGSVLFSIQSDLARLVVLQSQPPSENPLLKFSRRYFSQSDEDGILLEIIRRVHLKEPSVFLEFGVGNGTECNTIILLARGWRGSWCGGEPLAFSCPPGGRLGFLQKWITKDNAADLAQEILAKQDADLTDVTVASIDLDGNDGTIVRTLLAAGLSPDIMIVEYNSKLPPDVKFEMKYNELHVWQGGDYFGVSLSSWVNILEDYQLVACNENGANAFFVKVKHADQFADVPKQIEKIYRLGTYGTCPAAGYATTPQMVRQLAE